MARKPKAPAPKADNFPRKEIPLRVLATDNEEVVAHKRTALMTSAEMAAFRVIHASERQSGVSESLDVPALLDQLQDQAVAVNRGDLAQAEAMLMNQSVALQTLFARLAEKAMTAEYLPQFDGFMRMALRAQSQCRATLETLAAIKNPPVVFAKQANISHGHQQVNNGTPTPPCAEETENPRNKLLEQSDGERLDTGTAGQASGIDPAMGAVGAIYRAKDTGG